MALASIAVYGMQQFALLQDMNTVESNMQEASYLLRTHMIQAVNLAVTGGPVAPAAGATQGQIGGIIAPWVPCTAAAPFACGADTCPAAAAGACYGYDSSATAQDGNPEIVAVFNEEVGTTSSLFRAMGIFFQKPNSNLKGPASSGVLYIATDPTGVNLHPSPDGIFFDQLVSMRVEVTPVGPGLTNPAARSARIVLTSRYFLDSDQSKWDYTPANLNLVGGNAEMLPFGKDVVTTIDIGFRNNALRASLISGEAVVERLHGNVYYFKFTPPALPLANF